MGKGIRVDFVLVYHFWKWMVRIRHDDLLWSQPYMVILFVMIFSNDGIALCKAKIIMLSTVDNYSLRNTWNII